MTGVQTCALPILAGTPSKYGVQFVTWDWDYDRTGVVHGHYFMENYPQIKGLNWKVKRK